MIELISHEILLSHVFRFLDEQDMEKNVFQAIQNRNLSDLHFMVGTTKATVPTYIKNNKRFSLAAGLDAWLLPELKRLGFKLHKNLFCYAAEQGDVYMLKWLEEKGCEWNEKTITTVIQNHGNLYLCKWLKRKGCPWDGYTFFMATGYKGHRKMELLQWLLDNGCPWDTQTYSNAIMMDDMTTVKWLREHGCPWDAQAFLGAAIRENLDMMKWLKTSNCPWDERTYEVIVEAENHEILNWLIKNNCPTKRDFFDDESANSANDIDEETLM
jgi:hypothetical protein